ncbi:DUF2235 domain-containing protein [Sphingopyxis sp. R3-92]|uniref:DUF2235 domain-containing protein n=1 Tax=Sphingopyxis sp. R3-92 TaxID=3158553 RepID=UPI003EE7BC59
MAKTPETPAGTAPKRETSKGIQGRNLVILCDGTGNELGGALAGEIGDIRISNVLKLYRIAEKGQRQLVYYSPGVGTVGRIDWLYRWKQKFLGVLGLAAGYGLDDNLLGAYRFLAENWEEGDRIYIFGFSRGAWTARVLAGMLHLIGLVRPSQLNMCDNALATYKRAAREKQMPIAWHFARVIGARFPTIHFVGVWDTVASVLVPRSDRMWIPSLETLPYTAANPSLRTFRHALALDERRRMFRVANWVQPQPFIANRFRPGEKTEQDIEQRWFPGVHSDIGGGYPERESALSKRPLIWMVEEAKKAGLKITAANLRKLAYGEKKGEGEHQYVAPDAAGPMHMSLTLGWKPLEIIPKRTSYREWKRRSLFGFYFPLAEPRPVAGAHVIDDSIAERRARQPAYKPVNHRSPERAAT